MNRVLVLGSGASGKTTFSLKLSEKTGLPLYHLDSLYWSPGWKATEEKAWREKVADLVQKDRWIIDGSYGGTLDLRIPHADTILFLDISNWQCVWNILKRRIKYSRLSGKTRPGMPVDCPERIYFSFVMWVWTYPWRKKPGVLKAINDLKKPDTEVKIFRSYGEMNRFLDRIESTDIQL